MLFTYYCSVVHKTYAFSINILCKEEKKIIDKQKTKNEKKEIIDFYNKNAHKNVHLIDIYFYKTKSKYSFLLYRD